MEIIIDKPCFHITFIMRLFFDFDIFKKALELNSVIILIYQTPPLLPNKLQIINEINRLILVVGTIL